MNHALRKILPSLALAFLCLGCGNSHRSQSTKTEEYTYKHEENGCKTGEHVATSLKRHCENLANEELNHYCAASIRKATFDQTCAGTDVEWTTVISAESEPLPEEDDTYSNLNSSI
jgi:hypothetical protein